MDKMNGTFHVRSCELVQKSRDMFAPDFISVELDLANNAVLSRPNI